MEAGERAWGGRRRTRSSGKGVACKRGLGGGLAAREGTKQGWEETAWRKWQGAGGKDTEVSHPVPLPPSSTFHPQPLAQLPPRPQFHSPQAQIWSSPISFGPTGPAPR